MVIRQISAEVVSLKKKQETLVQDMQTWIAVYHENTVFPSELKVEKLIKIDKVVKAKGNIAGVTIPVFKELTFVPISYNLADYPLWVDKGLESLRDLARYDALIATLEQQVRLLEKELRTTSQRVNLFEKVKIPEAKDNIRRIAIYLGDQQTAAVVRGKIAKKKLMQGA
jgi:V/A-type H+-transporting ATPase subunit D